MPRLALVVDLNADVGEGHGAWRMGDDEALLGLVSSANVACGFHAGDPVIMAQTCQYAADHGVAVGAHVSYRDLTGFGRRDMDLSPAELMGEVLYQLGALDGIARAAGTEVRYVKAHGALYNRMVHDRVQAGAVIEAVRRFRSDLPLVTLPGSVVVELAGEAGMATVAECFADRAYTSAGTLVSRRQPGAVIHDATIITARVLRMITEKRLQSIDGTDIDIDAATVCLHGDTPGAVASAQHLRQALTQAGVSIRPFAGGNAS